MALTQAERRIAAARARVYPKGMGGHWGVTPKGEKCHLSCFTTDYDNAPHQGSKAIYTKQTHGYGEPAIAVAAARGNLTLRGINQAYDDLRAFVWAAEGEHYSNLLNTSPYFVSLILLREFEGDGKKV